MSFRENTDDEVHQDGINRDGSCEEEITTTLESCNIERNRIDNTITRFDLDRDLRCNQNDVDFGTDRYGSCFNREAPNNFMNTPPIRTSGVEETNRYLDRLGDQVYRDPNPQVSHRDATGFPITAEQRVFLRCLQPPRPPSPEPLIIIEKRPDQPPPPPVIIHEHEPAPSPPAPLILREKPPVPPPRIPGETVIRWLPAVSLPRRSLVVERFPAQEKPPDIIIERWLPYGPPRERRTIVQPAPPPTRYPAPTHKIIIHDKDAVRIVRKIEKLGITREDPEAYERRYGSSLLDPDVLLEQARRAGVIEDITCTCPRPPPPTATYEEPSICETSQTINQCRCSFGGRYTSSCRETIGFPSTEAVTNTHGYYSSFVSRRTNCDGSCSCVAIQNSDFTAC